MTIRFSKGKNGKPDTMACVRDDGSSTWEPSQVGIKHDLIHYAVETTLGYEEAFFGLIARGRDIAAFGTKNGRKDVYTAEENWAEGLVGLLQWPAVGGGLPLTDGDFRDMLAQYSSQSGRPAPEITPEQLADIRVLICDLHAQWDHLPPGETMELVFLPALRKC